MDMRKEKWWVDYDMCAKLAVHKYNSYFKVWSAMSYDDDDSL